MKKRKKSSGAFLFGLVIVALATVGYGAGPGGWFRADDTEELEGVPVRRGPLRISELSRGNLQSKNAARLINQLWGSPTIIYLAEEGSYVEEGDLICEFDVTDLEDRQVTQEIEVRSAGAEYTKAKEQYEIQEIQNETDEAEAALALMLARLDLEKYVDLGALPEDYDPLEDDAPKEGEWAHELAQALESIKLAELNLTRDEETLKWTRELYTKGFVQKTELDGDELQVEQRRINLEQVQREYELARKYGYQRKLAELTSAVESRERDVLKVTKQSVAKLADYEAERESDKYRLEREKERMREIEDQLTRGKIFAPISGMLVYSQSRGGRMGGGEVPQEGSTVHERQEIATIPSTGGMTVDVSLHETKLDNVRKGQTVLVKVDAIPGRVFQGRVEYVAAVADSGSWMSNPNQRLYKTEVALLDFTEEMRPGMSCEVEILIDDLQDVLHVPRQSVYLDGNKTVVFVKENGEVKEREVTVGLDNNKWVVIENGLAEGDSVLLAPPASWEPSEAVETTFDPDVKAVKVEPGAVPTGPDGAEGAAGPMGRIDPTNLTPEQRSRFERFQNMSDEERAAEMEKLRQQYGGGGNLGRGPGGDRGDRGGGGERRGGGRGGGGRGGGGGGA